MHASATSRLSSPPVNQQAPQANDASRADQDSPFALLMAASAPKDEKPAREQNDVEKPANDQAAAAAQPAKPQARAEPKPKAKADEKSKPDDTATADKDGQDKSGDVAVANDNSAPAPVMESKPAATNPVPQPIVPLIVIADAGNKTSVSEAPVQENAAPVAAAAPSQPATPPVQDLAALTAAQAPANSTASQTPPAADAAPATAETQTAPQPPVQQAAAPQAAQPQAPTAEAPQDASSVQSQPAAPQILVPQTAEPQSTAPQTDVAENAATAPSKEAVVQIAALQTAPKPAQAGEQKDAAASAPIDTSLKTDTAKPVTHDVPAQHAENKDAKTDAPRPENAKAEAVKPEAAQTASVETPAPKSAPPVQVQPGTNIASMQPNTATQPLQPASPAALPGMPQHVQVSTQANQPNMPALAVEIAAKSQSGAKQFDIRLDPPELGRVEVRLSIDATGKASAHLSADQPQTLDLLQKDASSLTRALREAGLNVSQDGLNFSLRQQSHDGNGAQQGQGRSASRGMTLVATNSIEATQNSATWRGDGRLDIRV